MQKARGGLRVKQAVLGRAAALSRAARGRDERRFDPADREARNLNWRRSWTRRSFYTDEIEQVRKRGLPPPLPGSTSGGKPLFLTCSILTRSDSLALNIVVQRKLERVWAHAERRDLSITLVSNPALDQLRTEHIALEQEVVIGFQCL